MCLYSWITQAFCGPRFLQIPRNLAKPSERKPLERSVYSISFVLRLFSKILELGDQGMIRKRSGLRTSWGTRQDVGLSASPWGQTYYSGLAAPYASTIPVCLFHGHSLPHVASHVSGFQHNVPADCQEVFFTPGWPVRAVTTVWGPEKFNGKSEAI